MSALHHVFHRYHNTIEERLHRLNAYWGGERLYQEARKIVGALWQFIVYNEYVPTVVGPELTKRLNLKLARRGYDDRE